MNREDKGFTLLEMILVILILGIISGIATYSVNVIYNGNTKSSANQFASAVREVKVKTLSSASGTSKWSIRLGYDTNKEKYYWEVSSKDTAGNIISTKQVLLKKDVAISVLKEGTGETEKDIRTAPVEVTFSNGLGSIITGAGEYRFKNKITNHTINVRLVKTTGGIFIEK